MSVGADHRIVWAEAPAEARAAIAVVQPSAIALVQFIGLRIPCLPQQD
jgi:hypothetical protein